MVEGLDQVLTADAVLVMADPAAVLRPAEAKALQLFVELGGSLLAMASAGRVDRAIQYLGTTSCSAVHLSTRTRPSHKVCAPGHSFGELLQPYGIAVSAVPQLSSAPSEQCIHPRTVRAAAAVPALQDALLAASATQTARPASSEPRPYSPASGAVKCVLV